MSGTHACPTHAAHMLAQGAHKEHELCLRALWEGEGGTRPALCGGYRGTCGPSRDAAGLRRGAAAGQVEGLEESEEIWTWTPAKRRVGSLDHSFHRWGSLYLQPTKAGVCVGEGRRGKSVCVCTVAGAIDEGHSGWAGSASCGKV
jgi:hypothetical protein